jgi:hypothetical protein
VGSLVFDSSFFLLAIAADLKWTGFTYLFLFFDMADRFLSAEV